jgi:formate-dependent nitrite reductase membrane component NrfD
MNRAERTPLPDLSAKERRLRRARNADDVMQGAFWTGVIAVGVGIPLLVGGAVLRKRAREDLTSRLELDPTGITVRF